MAVFWGEEERGGEYPSPALFAPFVPCFSISPNQHLDHTDLISAAYYKICSAIAYQIIAMWGKSQCRHKFRFLKEPEYGFMCLCAISSTERLWDTFLPLELWLPTKHKHSFSPEVTRQEWLNHNSHVFFAINIPGSQFPWKPGMCNNNLLLNWLN